MSSDLDEESSIDLLRERNLIRNQLGNNSFDLQEFLDFEQLIIDDISKQQDASINLELTGYEYSRLLTDVEIPEYSVNIRDSDDVTIPDVLEIKEQPKQVANPHQPAKTAPAPVNKQFELKVKQLSEANVNLQQKLMDSDMIIRNLRVKIAQFESMSSLKHNKELNQRLSQKDKDELSRVKRELTEVRDSARVKELKFKLNEDRLRRRVDELEARNKELLDEIKLLKTREHKENIVPVVSKRASPKPAAVQKQTQPELTKSIVYPNNVVRLLHPNGDDETIFPDGTISRIDRTGKKVVEFTNGCREVYWKDMKQRFEPNGTVKTVYPDGTREIRYPDGMRKLLLKQ